MRRVRFVEEPESTNNNNGSSLGPYRTREHLYYMPPESSSNGNQSNIDDKYKRQPTAAEEASMKPPTGSLYDLTNMSPQRKHEEGWTSKPAIPIAQGTQTPLKHQGDGWQEATEATDWITVFGFPSGSAAAVLEHFRGIGHVAEWRDCGGNGNWLHLRYTNTWSAQKALLKNGTVLPLLGSCMIGVVPSSQVIPHVESAAQGSLSPVRSTFTIPKPLLRKTSGEVEEEEECVSGKIPVQSQLPKPVKPLWIPRTPIRQPVDGFETSVTSTYVSSTPAAPIITAASAPPTPNAASPASNNSNTGGVMHRLASFVLNL